MRTHPETRRTRPGSRGEHELQEKYGTAGRACAFYSSQVLDRLNGPMRRFIEEREMVFVATANAGGEADCSFRAGPVGFVRALDDRTLAYPEYRGNGVLASLGNISENPHVGLFFVDFFRDTIGLHVNGAARIVENAAMLDRPGIPDSVREDATSTGGRRPERWVVVGVEEAYVHCSKHIPRLAHASKTIDWGTDDARKKGGDYFGVRAKR